jgi:hypothetical protein
MKHLELQVGLGVFGFFLASGLSLLSGNTMMTSLIRGAIGLLMLFLLGYVIKMALRTFVLEPQSEDVRGRHVDLLLPEQHPNEGDGKKENPDPAASEFVPLHQAIRNQIPNDEEARKMAEALRHLKDSD